MKSAAHSRLIVNDNDRVAEWCQSRIKHFSGWGSDPKAIGDERDGILIGGVVYTNYSGANVFASICLDAPIRRRFLYAIFYNPFVAWNLRHISCSIEASNEKSVRLCSNMGFIEEGRMRQAAMGGEDIILMGLLKSECRFI